ncbi:MULTISPECIES: FAD binding domain-containing protein [Variovorax]|uniref:FAD binding domain-containing protein n=1 Tax=Variovorax TaxID=34072 RepID=UPI001619BCB6|nr:MULTISPECIES: FAD binding domain-containing protein [unclassified Variovorax]MBB3639628.1 carbon-monoxide dehydrogenase medium subunit [Variovorax sp. BK613]MDN6887089.1 FAD binding domain-containing protein [Variovorax sp. CAN15]
MKAPKFAYARVLEVDEAIAALAAGAGATKAMSGSQSLGPMLNLRLARPAQVVDVAHIPDLRTVSRKADWIEIGAAVTHAEIEDGVHAPLAEHPMRQVARGIAYRAIRTRGTVGGSLAHADPAADWVVTFAALGARVTVRSPRGERTVEADAFMLGAYTTVLESDELIVSVAVPSQTHTTRWGYHKVCRKPGEFAEASAAVYFDASRKRARIVLGAADGPPLLLHSLAAEIALKGTGAAGREALRAAVQTALPERDAIDRKLFTASLERALDQSGIFADTRQAE